MNFFLTLSEGDVRSVDSHDLLTTREVSAVVFSHQP